MKVKSERMDQRSQLEELEKRAQTLPRRKKKTRTIPVIFNKTFDENFLSDFLAHILDPHRNGIGLEPLQKAVQGQSDKLDLFLEDLSSSHFKIEVYREFVFQDHRRIDILIIVENRFIIGIENKVFSAEADLQTIDYASSIFRDFPEYEYVLMYLTPYGASPSSQHFSSISYSFLLSQLEQVKMEPKTDRRSSFIFNDFILHLKEYIVKTKKDSVSDQTKLYIEYIDTIKSLEKYFREDARVAFDEFEDTLRSIFKEDYWRFRIKQDREWQQVFKIEWEMTDLFIHHEFLVSAESILTEEKITHLLEVEGRNKESFFSIFESEYERAQEEFFDLSLQYRPAARRKAIIYQEFENHYHRQTSNDNVLVDTLYKCKFIDDLVDRAVKKYREKMGLGS